MNNMKYYNDSLAYDFEMFMPRTAEKKDDNVIRMPDRTTRVRQHHAVRRMSVSVFAVLISFSILAALCANLFLRLQINEVNDDINDLKAQIGEMDSVRTGLEVEYDRRVSYFNLEQEAGELGMSKRTKDQVRYIRVNGTDTARNADGVCLEEN